MARTSPKQKLFNGRDHSWMQFNRRVLEEAEDPSNPLLERVKFLAITGSNLDEYVEVRQAGLMQRIEDGYREPGYDGLRPDESLAVLTAEIHSFVDAQYRCWNEQLLPELGKQGIRLLEWRELDEEASAFAQSYFQREVDPLLTPISIDPAHPFPRVLNKALCLALLLRRKRKSSGPQVLGVVTVPRALPRFVRLPGAERRIRLPPAAGPDRAEPGRHVPRLRGALPRRLPRHPQLQPLLRGGRSPLPAGDHPRRAPQPPQGRRRAPGDRDRRRCGDRRAAARQLRAGTRIRSSAATAR